MFRTSVFSKFAWPMTSNCAKQLLNSYTITTFTVERGIASRAENLVSVVNVALYENATPTITELFGMTHSTAKCLSIESIKFMPDNLP